MRLMGIFSFLRIPLQCFAISATILAVSLDRSEAAGTGDRLWKRVETQVGTDPDPSSRDSAAPCSIERAHYSLRGLPSVTATFRLIPKLLNWSSGIALSIHAGDQGRSYWFLPYSGNGQGVRMHLASTEDIDAPGWAPPNLDSSDHRPLGDLDYIGADGGYNF